MCTRTWLRRMCLSMMVVLLLLFSSAAYAQNSGSVRILIIDDFSVPPDSTEGEVFAAGSEIANQIVAPRLMAVPAVAEINLNAFRFDLCAVNPEVLSGQGKLGMHRTMGPTVPNYSHGTVVQEIVQDTLQSLGGTRSISIETIDIAQASAPTDSGIADLIRRYANMDRNRPLIVNMSFAFVPCELLNNSEFVQPATTASIDLLDWRADIATSALEQVLAPLPSMINPDFTHIDPALLHLTEPLTQVAEEFPNVIMVASAGNFDVPYPLLPAGFPGVVSVGTLDPRQHFNDGEVAADSTWSMGEYSGEGTSFAAPRVTATIATYLRDHATRCLSGGIPFNFQDGPQQQWQNVEISGATGCPNDVVITEIITNMVVEPPPPGSYGDVNLQAGFTPDPYTVAIVSGGSRNAAELGCAGFIADQHDFRLDWGGNSRRVRIFFRGDGDTTLVVIGPNGEQHCNDDGSGFHPVVDIQNPPQGSYRIWVGSYAEGAYHNGVLSITELDLLP